MNGFRTPKTHRRALPAVAVLSASLVCLTSAANAHHSLLAEFDPDRTVRMTGVVTKVEWTNPHTYFYIDVDTEIGSIERWAWELASPNGLLRHGWTANTLSVGDRITANGTPARDGSRKAITRSVVLKDGQLLSAALGDDDQ